MFSHTSILGVKIATTPKPDLLAFIVNYLNSQKSSKHIKIYTPNPEQIVYTHEHPEFKEVLNSSDINLPDGVGIEWASKQLRITNYELRIKEKENKIHDSVFGIHDSISRIPGVEFMVDLVKLAAKNNWPVALIGGRNGVAKLALKNLQIKYPRLAGWAEEPGELSLSDLSNLGYLEEKIRLTNTRLVFVGLGVPKQEYFIAKLSSQFVVRSSQLEEKETAANRPLPTAHSLALMSVGGAFDILSDKIKRAPSLIRTLGFEWLWRLVCEPWRIKRQLKLLKFIYLVVEERFMVK